jgi:hypothetical protein
MTTCGEIITEASSQLHGWGGTADRLTPLSANIGPTDTTFTVDFAFGQAVGITPGVVEIDEEQLYVVSVDATTGVCTLANGVGRGYGGTTAASHTGGSAVISRPRFPRAQILRQLNNILGGVFPDLFQVKSYQTVVTCPSNTYTLPGVTGPIFTLDAQWQDPVGNWHRCFSYTIDSYDNTFRLGDGIPVGRPLRILYAAQPGTFTAETDDFATATGLPLSCADVLSLGVVARMVPALDISRAQLTSMEQSDRSRVVPPNQAINAGKYLMGEFQMRLANEAQSLRMQYKARLRRTF